MLQALNILEGVDQKAMGFNSPRYINTIYQSMSLAFADRDFYYGDPYEGPEEPVKGLLSKEYVKTRLAQLSFDRNDPNVKPGDPYPFQGGANPFKDLLAKWTVVPAPDTLKRSGQQDKPVPNDSAFFESFYAGTTSIEAADSAGWVVSITPSGGWVPAVSAGKTGVGLSQRMQSFVLDPAENPFNVVEPGKHPRATLTPTLALKDGKPYLSFAVQGGDSQDQNLLQFFLNVVEWGMTPQQATEAPNINSYQMRSSFGAPSLSASVGVSVTRGCLPGAMTLNGPSSGAVTKHCARRLRPIPVRPAITAGTHPPLGVIGTTRPAESAASMEEVPA